MKKYLKSGSFISILMLLLIGCGGGGGSSAGTANPTATTTTGTFIDDKVSGVKYVNGSATGFTDANGQFPYTSGVISFYIGNIKLGEMSSLPSDNKVFVQDVVGVDRSITTNAKVLKIASILQSLDSDTTTDAIEIKESDFNKFNDVYTTIDENTNVSTILTSKIPSITVKTQEDIQRHLENSLKQYTNVSSNSNPLTLTTSSITTGSVNVSKDASIVLTFNNDIKKSSINKDNVVLKDASSNTVDLTITHEYNRVTIKPVSLDYSTTYSLTIKSSIEDFIGSHLGTTDTIIGFTTQSEPDTSSPVFTSSATVNVSENQTSALTVKATDSSNITYSISGTNASSFNINSSTGVVTFKSAPDYETKSSYSIVVTAKDSLNNSSSQNVTINITNVDEGTVGSDDYSNSQIGATQISLNTRTTGNLELSDDVDYLKFELSARTTVTIESLGTLNNGNFEIYKEGISTKLFDSSFNNYNIKTDNLTLDAGVYYIKVYSILNYLTGYDITVSGSSGTVGSDDYSNSQIGATQISLNTRTTGNLELSDDVDYLKFELSARTTVTIESLGTLNNGNFEIYKEGISTKLFDSSFNNYNIKTDNLTLDAGVYYIKVYSILNYLTGYDITVSGSSGTVGSDDYSNSQIGATQISLNTRTTGNLELSDDVDYLKFELSARTTVTIESLGTLNNGNFGLIKKNGS